MTANLVNVLMGGVFHAAILFLVAAGLQVVFGVQKIFNLACGSFYALGAYTGVSSVAYFTGHGGAPALFIVPLVLGGIAVGLVGVVVERGLLRFVYDRDETFQLLLTFALVLMLEDLIRMTWGTAPVSTGGLYLNYGQAKILGATVPVYNVVVIGGLGSMRGAFVGALVVGVLRSVAISVYPELEMLLIYLIVIAVLIWRPSGLFGAAAA